MLIKRFICICICVLGMGASSASDLKSNIIGTWIVGPDKPEHVKSDHVISILEFNKDYTVKLYHRKVNYTLSGVWEIKYGGVKIKYNPGTQQEIKASATLLWDGLLTYKMDYQVTENAIKQTPQLSHITAESIRDTYNKKITVHNKKMPELNTRKTPDLQNQNNNTKKKAPQDLEEKHDIPSIMIAVKDYFNNKSEYHKMYSLVDITGIRLVDTQGYKMVGEQESLHAYVWYKSMHKKTKKLSKESLHIFNVYVNDDKYIVKTMNKPRVSDKFVRNDEFKEIAKRNLELGR